MALELGRAGPSVYHSAFHFGPQPHQIVGREREYGFKLCPHQGGVVSLTGAALQNVPLVVCSDMIEFPFRITQVGQGATNRMAVGSNVRYALKIANDLDTGGGLNATGVDVLAQTSLGAVSFFNMTVEWQKHPISFDSLAPRAAIKAIVDQNVTATLVFGIVVTFERLYDCRL